jgi:hypothetical protein
MTEIRNWLESIGLGQYGDAFEANDIDMDLLTQVDPAVSVTSRAGRNDRSIGRPQQSLYRPPRSSTPGFIPRQYWSPCRGTGKMHIRLPRMPAPDIGRILFFKRDQGS